MSNQIKTVLLLGSLTALIIFIGNAVGGRQGMYFAFFFAVLINFGSYWFSDKIVLRLYRAEEASPQDFSWLYSIVSRLSQSAGIPQPRIFIIPSDSPNAFATGRNPEHAVVAATTGIMRILSRDELEGVIAHELGHVKNRDILISSIAATMAGAIMMLGSMVRWAAMFGGFSRSDDDDQGGGLAGMIVLAIIAPIAAMLIQLAISRSREYLADATGASLAGTPMGLANALEKLESASQRIPLDSNPATAHLFIVNPLAGRSFINLFSTHPPIEERIKRLRGMR
ncbi:MAG TPA: zinc metalloprotease HtpX [Thermodesulfobacteriota bacterium]|jgi:heat shock protein HtpX|nr:zinc metalloprotease HtpX [Thermodesulfobacteriota bacterium]